MVQKVVQKMVQKIGNHRGYGFFERTIARTLAKHDQES